MMKTPTVKTLLEVTGILLAGVLLFAGLETPAAPAANLVYRGILFTGSMTLLFFACGAGLHPVTRLRVLGYGSVALLVLLQITAGAVGPFLEEEVPLRTTLTAVMWIAACCTILAVVGLSITGKRASDPAGTAAIPRMSASAPQPVSGEDRRFMAAHEQERIRAERRATEVVMLPLAGTPPADGSELTGDERPVQLADVGYRACRADFVLRLDGTTCLQLWDADGRLTRLEGDPLQVASWLQTTHDAGIAVGVQINESPVSETRLQPPAGRARKEAKK